MIHSASPQSKQAVIDFEVLGWTDGRTFCVKIVITTGRDCGRPRGSKSIPPPKKQPKGSYPNIVWNKMRKIEIDTK